MGKQFKKPFPDPGEQPRQVPPAPVSELETVEAPAVNLPPVSGMPPQGFVQGQYGQYGLPPGGQFPQSAGGPGGPRFMPDQIGRPVAGQPSGPPNMGQPANSLFAGMAPPPITPMSGPGMPAGLPATPAWNRPGALQEKPESVKKREKSQGKKGKKKRRVPIWARVIIGILLFFLVLVGGAFGYYQYYFAGTVNSITGKSFARAKGDGDPNQGQSDNVLEWKGRLNILLLGSDTDDKPGVWTGNKFLAQTVIVASIDISTHEVDMLSLPRDFYLNIPGHGLDKLDTAFAYGGSINNNMSGVSEVVTTLKHDFGIDINYYAWVGLQGFIKVINTVNGVDVNVMHPIVDDTYPDDVTAGGGSKSGFGYKRVYIGDGPQHLDGATALEYVRSRHSTSDFDRSARQQEVLSALRLKLDNVSVIGELPQIAQDLQGSLYTGLSTAQLLELGNFARGIDASKIQHLTLSAPKYGTSATAIVHGISEDVVNPNCNAIPAAINAFLHITTAICNIAYDPALQPPLLAASSTGGSSASPAAISNSADVSMIAESDTSWPVVPAWSDLFGVRDLLALMSMVVLDSPQV